MKNQGNYINYSELHFTSDTEQEKYLKLSKDYWTDEVFISHYDHKDANGYALRQNSNGATFVLAVRSSPITKLKL